MSKTYQLPVFGMAKKLAEGNYDTTSQVYFLGVDEEGCYVQFSQLPDVLKNVIPLGIDITLYGGSNSQSSSSLFEVRSLAGNLDIENRIYPSIGEKNTSSYIYLADRWFSFRLYYNDITTGIYIKVISGATQESTGAGKLYSEKSEFPPYATLTYDEGNQISILDYPKGYVDRTGTINFTWHVTWSGFPIESIAQTSAKLQWKNGESGTIHTINIPGSETAYQMEANTLPQSADIFWSIQATTANGAATSEWTKISTEDSAAVATAVYPNGIFVDGTKTARFAWSHSTEYGTAQTAYDLQINNGGEWTTVQSEQTANQYADIVPGTLAAGQTQWRVRTYNEDNVPGEWSNVLSCVVISSPAAPQVTVTIAAPRPTITWNAVGQQAYQVIAGSYDSGLIYGTEKTYKLPVFLPDGQTNLSVRVMNEYGYWSPYGTATATITNVPGDTITLNAEGGRDAVLAWNGIENAAEYWIFRNGKRIAKTTDTTYTDHYSIGSCTYRVRAAMADGLNYTDSNTTTVSVSVDHPVIKTLDGDWLDLPYTATQMQQTSSSLSRDVYLMHYNGAAYPVPEVGEFQNRTMSLSVAFADMEIGKILESMIGRIVCMKNQYGDLIIGIFSQIARAKNEFFATYSATIEEVDAGEIG